jgi:anti-anti-sigma factor
MQKENHFLIFTIQSEKINTLNAPELKTELVVQYNSHGAYNLIIDLSDVKYVDSSGLSALLVANRLCKDGDKLLVLCNAQEAVMDLIEISQLHSVLNITPTLQEAKDLITLQELERSILGDDETEE